MKRVGFNWKAGTGISYQCFYFEIAGGIGLLNMLDNSKAKFHENRMTFSIGFYL